MANVDTTFDVTPSEEVIKLTCLQAAVRFSDKTEPISLAKKMFDWVTEKQIRTNDR